MTRLRILHLVKTSVGGAWALRQMRELTRLGLDIHVALPEYGPLIPDYERAGVTVHYLPSLRGGLARVAASARELRSLVATLSPHILHSHFLATTLVMRAAAVPCLKRIFQVPGPLHVDQPLLARLEVRSAQQLDYWIGTCRHTYERYLALGVDPSRVFLSYYGGDLPKTESLPRGVLRRELGLDDYRPIVGMVAFMYAPKRLLGQRRGIKGHEDLIDALALLSGDAKVGGVFIGGPWDGATAYERQVKRHAARSRARVTFLGTRNDVASLYPDFTVAVHPSHSENLGGAGESLSLGIPTVATNVGGFPDIVKPGLTGWLVPPKSPGSLANAIKDALANRDKARLMAAEGQRLVRDLLDVHVTAREVEGVYHQVLASAAH